MMNPQGILPLIKRLEENDISYTLGGSGLLYYLGLVDSINDWDVMVDCSKEKLIQAATGYECTEQESGDYPFASEYRVQIHSLSMDIIGGFAFYLEGEMLKLPLTYIRNITWEGIHLSNPEVWYVAYQIMGRDEKANLILQYLQTNNEIVDQHLIKNLLSNNNLPDEIRKGLTTLIAT